MLAYRWTRDCLCFPPVSLTRPEDYELEMHLPSWAHPRQSMGLLLLFQSLERSPLAIAPDLGVAPGVAMGPGVAMKQPMLMLSLRLMIFDRQALAFSVLPKR